MKVWAVVEAVFWGGCGGGVSGSVERVGVAVWCVGGRAGFGSVVVADRANNGEKQRNTFFFARFFEKRAKKNVPGVNTRYIFSSYKNLKKD